MPKTNIWKIVAAEDREAAGSGKGAKQRGFVERFLETRIAPKRRRASPVYNAAGLKRDVVFS